MNKVKKILVMALVLVGVLSVSVFPQAQRASSWGLDFSFGGSTARDSATMQRSFPRNVPVTATVVISVKRASQKSGTSPVGAMSIAPVFPVIVELKSPPSVISDEKSSTVISKEVLIGSSSKTITLVGSPHTVGCGTNWTVNIRPVNADNLTEYTFSGRTTMSFPPATHEYSIDGSGNFNLPQNHSVEKEMIGPDFDEEGVAEITGEWFSAQDPQVPIRMKIELIYKGNGILVDADQGYPINETRTGAEYRKLKISRLVNGSLSNYKLRITNTGSGTEAVKIRIILKKIRTCG